MARTGAHHSALWDKAFTDEKCEAARLTKACGCGVMPAKGCSGGGGDWLEADEGAPAAPAPAAQRPDPRTAWPEPFLPRPAAAAQQPPAALAPRPKRGVVSALPTSRLLILSAPFVSASPQRKRTSSTRRSSSSAPRCFSRTLRCSCARAPLRVPAQRLRVPARCKLRASRVGNAGAV